MTSIDKPKRELEHRGFRFFATVGRFSVKFRWLVVCIWVVGTVLAVKTLPSLSSVTQSNNGAFLPASAPSEKAIQLETAFGQTNNAQPIPVIIATDNGKPLSVADETAITRLETNLSHVPNVEKIRSAGLSGDGQAIELIVLARVNGVDPSPLVNNLRTAIGRTQIPSNLQAQLAGEIATNVDNSKTSGTTNSELQLGSVIFIIVLLLIIFRAPLAPLITLIPPFLVVLLVGPLIAEAAHHGLKVSSLAQLLLTVLILGAGTDYGLFLIFRVREEIKSGLENHEAIIKGLSRVGESISFSAATVVAALLSLLLATFQIYSDLGEPLAIGITLMLLAGLTLLPALLAIFGRAAFWPSNKYKPNSKNGLWGGISASVVQHPIPVLIAGVIVFGGLSVGVFGYRASGFAGNTTPPPNSGSSIGNALLAKHYPSSTANPTELLFKLPVSIWQQPQELSIVTAQIKRAPQFNSVTGPLNPNGVTLSPREIKTLYDTYGPPQTLKVTPGQPRISEAVSPLLPTYETLGNYISRDGKTIQFSVGLTAGNPGATAAMNAVPQIRNVVNRIGTAVQASHTGVAGQAPVLYDISNISNNDLLRVIPIAVIVIGVLLGILLRSLVAPLYLIVSVVISYLAAFGLAVIVFMFIGHESGLDFILPFLMFIFLLALGEDYNILVMTRIREEAHGQNLSKAVSQALITTGTTVTSAGLVLAGTFSILAVVGGSSDSQIRDIGAGLALGILMDTFLVRTLLVPSLVVLLGNWNWWPSRRGGWLEK